MRETLYLRLTAAAPETLVAHAVASGEPGPALRAEHAPLAQVLAAADGRRLVVFVPGSDVRLTSVTVPAKQTQKVLQAAPYALEEQLAEDVDRLHFAVGAREPDGHHPVAVVTRERMAQWLEPFGARGLKPDALVPETLCLPWGGDDRYGVLAEERLVTVRTGLHAGFTCVAEDLETHLQLADAEKRYGLRILLPRQLERDFTALGRPVELLPAYGDVLESLAQQWKPASSINLLQGAYSQTADVARLWQPWRLAAGLAGACLLLALAAEAASSLRLGRELARQEARNVERFQQLFPAEQRIVDLAAQAEQQIALLRGSGKAGGMMALVQTLAQALSATPGLSVQSLQFKEGALYLSLTGSDLQVLENLRGWFSARRDAAMEVQSANAGAEGVQIRLKLSAA